MPTTMDDVHQADEELVGAVDNAIDNAVRPADDQLRSLAVSASPYDYFRDAAL